jgi:hypothetical protein
MQDRQLNNLVEFLRAATNAVPKVVTLDAIYEAAHRSSIDPKRNRIWLSNKIVLPKRLGLATSVFSSEPGVRGKVISGH